MAKWGSDTIVKPSTDDGGAAFPHKDNYCVNPGMTLRDWFAGMALQGLMSSERDGECKGAKINAACAYKFADAMLDARVRNDLT